MCIAFDDRFGMASADDTMKELKKTPEMGTVGGYDHELRDSAVFVANLYGRQLPNSALEASVTVMDTVEALHKRKRDAEGWF